MKPGSDRTGNGLRSHLLARSGVWARGGWRRLRLTGTVRTIACLPAERASHNYSATKEPCARASGTRAAPQRPRPPIFRIVSASEYCKVIHEGRFTGSKTETVQRADHLHEVGGPADDLKRARELEQQTGVASVRVAKPGRQQIWELAGRRHAIWWQWTTLPRPVMTEIGNTALAGDAGQAAVALESGKRKTASFRWGCNKRLRKAFCTLADSTRHWHPWAQALYAAAIARGHEHPRAIRTLGRAWCRVVWQCWQKRTPYDPARHRALQQHITVTIPTASAPVVDEGATLRMAADAFAINPRPDSKKVTAAN